MPPYTREIATSSRAALNDLNGRGAKPMSTCVESTNGIVSPSTRDNTCDAAADSVEWPDGYSGKGGVANRVTHFGSNTRCTYVTGRSTSDLYFSRQQPMNASAIAIDVSVYS